MKRLHLAVTIIILLFLLLALLLRTPAAHTETEFLMNTVVSVTAYGAGAKEAVQRAFVRIREIDAKLDAYDPESQIYALNQAPAQTPVPLDEEVFSLLQKALAFTEHTQGAFDATLLPVSSLWGFGTKEARVPDAAALENALRVTGPALFTPDAETRTVTKEQSGAALDFGAIAKGYAADEAVRVLKEAGIRHAYLDLGGNVAVFGGKPLSPLAALFQGSRSRPFTIGLQKPDAPRGEIIETVHLTEGFIVTSGDYERYFTADGIRYHHILDPKTGRPADSGQRSVTAICQSGTEADILSTALFVAGPSLADELSPYYDRLIFIDHTLGLTTVTP